LLRGLVPLEALLNDLYSEAETHRHRCGRVVPRVSVDPNCGIRVEKKDGVAMYRQRRNVSASYEKFILAARSKEEAGRARKTWRTAETH
jgi:hypothetical protein